MFAFNNLRANLSINFDRAVFQQRFAKINYLKIHRFIKISTILSVSAKVESERDGTICALCFGRYQPKIESLQRIYCSPCNSLINEMKEEGKTLLINEILNC